MSKGRMCSQWLMASLALIWSAAGTGFVSAATLYVSKSGNDGNNGQSWTTAKLTVQAGLNTAVSGDQVWVAAGTYVENITLKAGVALYGGFDGTEDPATFDLADRDFAANETILDGNQAGSVVTAPQNATASTRIDGFTIRDGYGEYGGGIYCSSSSPMIANNTIMGNVAFSGTFYTGGGGICCLGGSPTITNNTIMGNSGYIGGGIYCDYSSPTIANNTITGNSSDYGGGIYCYSSSPTIANNTITGNGGWVGGGIYCRISSPMIANNTITGNSSTYGGGIYCESSSPTIANTIIAFNSSGICKYGTSGTLTLLYNCVYGNTAYNYSGITDPTGTDGNISVAPKLADLAFGNVHIQSDSPCVDAGGNAYAFGERDLDGQSRIQPAEGTVDIGADESDGSDWPSGPYAIIRVAPDGDDAHDGSSWALAKRTVQAGIDAAAALGGEVWVRAGTYNERITLLPYAYLYGGFAGTEDARDERDWVTNASVIDGQQGGTVVSARAGHQVSRIDGFTIRNGYGEYGGGIYCYFSSPTIANNTITDNKSYGYGGGIYCYYSSPTIANNTIRGNSSSNMGGAGGGIFCHYSSPTIANNTITGNSATSGGGIYCEDSSSPTIANNTITGNSSYYSGGGIYCSSSSSPTIANTIIAFNSSGIYKSGGTPTLRYNCVYGNTAYNYSGITDPTGANGNISADPRFVQVDPGVDGIWGTADDDFSDLRLLADSPCIDAGDNASVPAGITTDLAGILRFLDNPDVPDTGSGTPPVVDMGAYEYLTTVAADFSNDGDVGAQDFEIFAACVTAPAVPYDPMALPASPTGCPLTPDGNGHIAADFDRDGDVDQEDFGIFQRCYSGEDALPDPVCAG